MWARRRWRRPGLFTIVALMGIGGALTLAGQPFFPDRWTEWIQDAQLEIEDRVRDEEVSAPGATQVIESYVLRESSRRSRTELLRTVGEWSGSGNAEFSFKAEETPWVLWWDSARTSGLGSNFEMYVKRDRSSELDLAWNILSGAPEGYISVDVLGSQNFVVLPDEKRVEFQIRAAGVDWLVKIGVEP